MDERDFDVVVVGSGCAGAIAAFVAAKRGKSVLVVDRAVEPGSKNMTGGWLYAHSLRSVLDAYAPGDVAWGDIPFERKVAHERIALMGSRSSFTVDFTSDALGRESCDSYTLLRGPFDAWLAELAEGAGAEYIWGIPVEELVRDEGGAVCGIRAGEDVITAQVVIDAEGVNTLLAERCLGATRPRPNEVAVGIKQVFLLSSAQVEDRFLCAEGEGAAMLLVGDCTHGSVGGGFLYTNRDTVSLGLVATISELGKSDTTVYQALEDFKHHPAVAPILRGAKVVEHSGHMVSEGGYNMVPVHTHDGCLVAGDAAMLCMNLGYQVRGMDFAIASGRFAAEAACEAIDAGNVSAAGLVGYEKRLQDSFVMRDLKTFSAWPAFMERWGAMFNDYPDLAALVMEALFVVDGEPQEHLSRRLTPVLKEYGLLKLARELRGALKVL